jgi:hypothetical protein
MKAQGEKRSHVPFAMRIRRSSDMIALVVLHLAELRIINRTKMFHAKRFGNIWAKASGPRPFLPRKKWRSFG